LARKYIYADEAGNFDFNRKSGASQYFILATVTLNDCSVGDSLLRLRRELAWQGVQLSQEFHATEDTQVVRDQVFSVIASHNFRIDVTILEKSKTVPYLQDRPDRFYKQAWHIHLKYIAPQIVTLDDELLVVGASLGTRKRRAAFLSDLNDVVAQATPTAIYRVAFWPASCDPCLQVADYCCWAIQRKWERGDSRSYNLIRNKIVTEFDVFALSKKNYY